MFRTDRFLTLYLFYPLQRLIRSDKGVRIPILMYHSISDDRGDDVHPYYRTVTSPEVFAEHMRFLYENGYQVISLSEAVAVLENSKPLAGSFSQPLNHLTNQPTNPSTTQRVNQSTNLANQPFNYVVLTFDDGFHDFYTHAFPIMQQYNFTATVFLITRFVGNGLFKEKECLSWDHVRELHNEGISFGSHTFTHPQLKALSKREVERELDDSKKMIEDELSEPIESFSYPYKFPEEDIRFRGFLSDTLERCGYRVGVTTKLGRASREDGCFFMKRLPVNSCDDPALFKAKLQGGYDWLHIPQFMLKKAKTMV